MTNQLEEIIKGWTAATGERDLPARLRWLELVDQLIKYRMGPVPNADLSAVLPRALVPKLKPLSDLATAALHGLAEQRVHDQAFADGDVWKDAPAKPFKAYNPAPLEGNGSFGTKSRDWQTVDGPVPVDGPHMMSLSNDERDRGLTSEDINAWYLLPGAKGRYTYAGWQTYKRGPAPARPTCLHDQLDERSTLEMRVASGVGFSITCKGCDLQRIVYTIK